MSPAGSRCYSVTQFRSRCCFLPKIGSLLLGENMRRQTLKYIHRLAMKFTLIPNKNKSFLMISKYCVRLFIKPHTPDKLERSMRTEYYSKPIAEHTFAITTPLLRRSYDDFRSDQINYYPLNPLTPDQLYGCFLPAVWSIIGMWLRRRVLLLMMLLLRQHRCGFAWQNTESHRIPEDVRKRLSRFCDLYSPHTVNLSAELPRG